MSSLSLPQNTPQQLRELVRSAAATTPELIAVSETIAPCLPLGAFRRGDTIMVSGSASLTFLAVAEATRHGLWCGLVALPDLNFAAGDDVGVDLNRVVTVAKPATHLAAVTATLLDALDIVVLGISPELTSATLAKLSARARQRRKLLVLSASTNPFPPPRGVALTLTAVHHHWRGVADGAGYLREHAIELRVSGHGRATKERRYTVALTDQTSSGQPYRRL
jgi:hypothetical protein